MGCTISKFHNRIVDFAKSNANQEFTTISAHNLHTYLNSDNPNPKCIFIFGGLGSNKGEFIWEILSQSCENYLNNEKNAAARLLLGKEDIKLQGAKFSYSYIDVEKLIVENLDKRVKKLSSNVDGFYNSNTMLQPENILLNSNIDNSPLLLDSPDFAILEKKKSRRSSTSDELKTQLLLYSNIVTNSWVLGLIKKEIEDNNFGPHEKIFIINLVPNRITLFKNCLFLKQTPGFFNFNFNYIAINLVKNLTKRKDMEIKLDEHFDEINSNFINYFRVINKVIDIRVENVHQKFRLKLSTSKNAIQVSTRDDLISFIYMPKKDGLELNIFEFKFEDFVKILQLVKKTSLMFMINQEVELDDTVTLKLEDKNINFAHVRKFIELYRLIRYSLLFV